MQATGLGRPILQAVSYIGQTNEGVVYSDGKMLPPWDAGGNAFEPTRLPSSTHREVTMTELPSERVSTRERTMKYATCG